MRARELFVVVVFLALALFPGCDTGRFTASQSVGLITRGAAAIQEHWDPELVGDAMPGSILQLEGLYATLPEDDRVGLELLRAYVSYAYGWLEPEADEAEARGDLDAQDATMRRARLMYLRARNVGLHHIRLRDAGFEAAVSGDHDAFVRYLDERYRTAGDVPFLLWTGYAWGSAISVATDDPELVLDLPKVRAMVERAVVLDPAYFEHGGEMFLGALASSVPETLGGDPAQGRALFERALAGTGRTFFQIQLQYARTYAVTTGDRALFVSLLREIIDGGDPRADVRLANRLARRRAIRLLQRVDELF